VAEGHTLIKKINKTWLFHLNYNEVSYHTHSMHFQSHFSVAPVFHLINIVVRYVKIAILLCSISQNKSNFNAKSKINKKY
jgi:hypothetical protein